MLDGQSDAVNNALFKPTAKDMKLEYPELASEPEFARLQKEKLAFVWYYANKTSPFSSLPTTGPLGIKRVFSSLQKSGLGKKLSQEDMSDYLNGLFPTDINSAIQKMQSYMPSERMRSMLMIEKIFSDFEYITSQTPPKDIDEQTKFVTTRVKITESLPGVIKLLESKFGITSDDATKTDSRGPKIADEVIE